MSVNKPMPPTGQHVHHMSSAAGHASNNNLNIEHWNKVANSYDDGFVEAIRQITVWVRCNLDFIGLDFLDPSLPAKEDKQIRVLDYACGPGTMTDIFSGYATEFIGLDISENMVKRYNERFSETGKAEAFIIDLLDPDGTPETANEPQYRDFDLVTSSGAFHHFDDVELATRRLADRLRPDGVLLVLDFKEHAPDDLRDHPALKTITHHGFTEDHIKKLFTSAGLEDVRILTSPNDIHFNGNNTRRPFLARGTKPRPKSVKLVEAGEGNDSKI